MIVFVEWIKTFFLKQKHKTNLILKSKTFSLSQAFPFSKETMGIFWRKCL